MKNAHMQPGTYRARVKSRRTIRDRGRHAVDVSFACTEKPLAGRPVSGRFFGHVLIERARALHQGQLVDVDVVTRRSTRGKPYTTVKDFRLAGKSTVVTFVNGVCTEPTGGIAHEFGPAALVTELSLAELEADRRELREQGIEPPPLPILHSSVLAQIKGLIVTGPKAVRKNDDASHFSVQADKFAADCSRSMLRVGGKKGRRTLVATDEVFAQYARVEPTVQPEMPAHLSVFEYTHDLRVYQQAHGGSVAGYRGVAWCRRCVVDFDGPNSLADVLQPARYFVTALVRLGIPEEQILVFFSGNRGVHVMFPSGVGGMAPRTNFEFATGQFCQVIADQATIMLCSPATALDERCAADASRGSQAPAVAWDPRDDATWHEAIDWNMYKPNAMLRAPNTRHEETGLYKIVLNFEELHVLDVDAIRQLAAAPRPFDPPAWQSTPLYVLSDLWPYAVAFADSRTFAMTQSIDSGDWVYGDTFDFMHNGAPVLTRAKRLFRAAVNLLQVGCSRGAAYQLLSPAALMCGLSPTEISHQIDGAVSYMRRPRQVRTSETASWPGTGESNPSNTNEEEA